MRAYKSLEAYNQVIEGWLRDVKVIATSDLKVVKGKVIRLISLNLFVFPRLQNYTIVNEKKIKACLFGNNTLPEFSHSLSLLLTHILSEQFFMDYFLKTRNNFQSFL